MQPNVVNIVVISLNVKQRKKLLGAMSIDLSLVHVKAANIILIKQQLLPKCNLIAVLMTGQEFYV